MRKLTDWRRDDCIPIYCSVLEVMLGFGFVRDIVTMAPSEREAYSGHDQC